MYQVVSEHRAGQATLVLRGKVAAAEIPLFLGRAYTEVAEHIGWSGLDFAGPPFARFRPLDGESREFEVEAGFFIGSLFIGGFAIFHRTFAAIDFRFLRAPQRAVALADLDGFLAQGFAKQGLGLGA